MGASDARVWACVVDGEPKSKARPRFSRKGHAYTPKETAISEAKLALHIGSMMKGKTLGCPVAIVAIFYRPNYQRIDADNLMKLVLDAGTKAHAWVDDSYITAQMSLVELDVKRPRTVIAIAETVSTLDRSRRFVCTVCGIAFNRQGIAAMAHPPKFCSRPCRYKGYAKTRAEVRCARCNCVFKRSRAGQRWCSRICAAQDPITRMKREFQRPWPKCTMCGRRVSRREYLRCAMCAERARPIGSKNKAKVTT